MSNAETKPTVGSEGKQCPIRILIVVASTVLPLPERILGDAGVEGDLRPSENINLVLTTISMWFGLRLNTY